MISNDHFIKVNVEGLLDLEVISREYQIPKHELIQFHNSNCEISELLPLHIPKYVPFIYVPKVNFETKSSRALPNSTLKYPLDRTEKKYGVVIKYLHSDLQIHFEVQISREGALVEINKKKSYVNNKEIVNIIEKIFEAAEGTLYPLKISLNTNGTLSKIENERSVNEKWQNEVLPKLKEYYVGETSEAILSRLDLVFKNLNSKKDFFLQSVFYKLVFFPIYQTYAGYKKEGEMDFYFANIHENISYKIQYELKKEVTRGDKIALQVFGEEQTDPFKKNKLGTIDMLYKLDKNSHEIFSVTGFASTFVKEKELKVEFQVFYIGDLN